MESRLVRQGRDGNGDNLPLIAHLNRGLTFPQRVNQTGVRHLSHGRGAGNVGRLQSHIPLTAVRVARQDQHLLRQARLVHQYVGGKELDAGYGARFLIVELHAFSNPLDQRVVVAGAHREPQPTAVRHTHCRLEEQEGLCRVCPIEAAA